MQEDNELARKLEENELNEEYVRKLKEEEENFWIA